MSKEKNRQKEKQEICTDCDEYIATAKRARADYENLKRETEKWKEEFVRYAHRDVIEDMLPVVDHFHEAMTHVTEDDQKKAWVQGIVFIKKQLDDVMKDHGVWLYAKEGDVFDPHLHEAMQEVADEKYKTGYVVKVVRQGCMMGEKIIRPAQVVISK